MKSSRSLMENLLVGSRVNENKLKEEMEELRKLTTETMMEKCLRKNQVVMCPKPRKRQMRQCGDHIDQKVGADLLDIFVNKASPPYYSGSPPIRSSNPLIRDARFHEQKVQQNPGVGVWMEGLDIPVNQTRRVQSILTMA